MYINVQSDIRTLQQAACRAQGCEWTPNIRHCWKKWPTKYMERIFGVPQSLLMPLGQCFSFNFAVALLSQHQSYINVWNTETENQYTAALCSLVHMCCDSVSSRIPCYSNKTWLFPASIWRTAEAPCTTACTKLYASKIRNGSHKKAHSKIVQDWV